MSVIRQPLTSLTQLQNLFGKTRTVNSSKPRLKTENPKKEVSKSKNIATVISPEKVNSDRKLITDKFSSPKQTIKQRNMRRDKNVAEILYDSQSTQDNLWCIQKFIKDFYYFLSQTESVKRTQDFSKVREDDFQYILNGLGFGESKELWNHITKDQIMLSRNMLIVLLAIINIQYQQIPLYIPRLDEMVPTCTYQQDENGNILLSPQECSQIHAQFYQLYLKTKQIQGNGQRRNQNVSPVSVINLMSERSRDLAEAKRNNMGLHDWFALWEQKRKGHVEAMKQQQSTQAESRETKSSKLTIDLTKLAKPVKKQQDKSTIDVEFENQHQFCTFSPQINPVKVFPPSTASTQYDIDHQAKRIREARVRQKTLEKLKSQGNTTNNQSRSQVKLQIEKSMSQEHKAKRVVLYVDVKVDDAKTVRLPIYNGDNSNNLAQQFAQEHNLNNSLEERLKDILEEQINSVVSV